MDEPKPNEPKPSRRSKRWLWVAILLLVIFVAGLAGGWWFGGRDSRSASKVVDSYAAVYAGTDSTKDVPSLVSLYADDAVLQDVAGDRTYNGVTDIKAALESLFTTPKYDLTITGTRVGNGWALIRWTANGTNVDTGRLAQVDGATLLQISKGKIVRETWFYDPAKAPF